MANKLLQRALYATLQTVGITAARRWWLRDRLTVVCIHGVMADDGARGAKPTRWQLKASELDRQLGILRQKYRFISIDEVAGVLEHGRSGDKPCCLFTIDDGYSSAWEIAWPILKRHGVPAAVFVASRHMQSGRPFWWDRLDYVIMHMPADTTEIHLGEHRIPVDLSSRRARADSARHITRHSRTLFAHEKDRFEALEKLIEAHEQEDWLDDLKSWTGVMSEGDVAAASRDGFEIGSHTVHHYRLGDLDREAVRRELGDSKAAIERVTGKPCRTFCFPEGSLNAVSREEVQAAGYEFAFCSDAGFNGADADRYALRRMHLPEGGSPAYLLARVCGLVDAISGLRTSLRPGQA